MNEFEDLKILMIEIFLSDKFRIGSDSPRLPNKMLTVQ